MWFHTKGYSISSAKSAPLLEVTPDSRLLQLASFSFDVAVFEWALTLGSGAMLILAPRQNLLPGPHLHEAFARWELSHLSTSPAWLSAMEPPPLPYPRVVFAGGEAGNPQVSARWLMGRRHFNAYGPSEITVACSILSIEPDQLAYSLNFKRPLLLGAPFGQVQLYVVDRWGQPVPFGVTGELWVGGVGVSRGYHRRPGLTARQFVPDPFRANPGARLYRTGDLVRLVRLGSGQQCLDFMGRIDFQVKLRGQRIELAEIEAVLAETEGVSQALVRLEGSGDTAMLVAYLQSELDLPNPLALAKARLPQYMVPSHALVLARFPLTPSGKIDLKALPKPVHAAPTVFSPPETVTELALAQIWARILNCPADSINRDDQFFELGGHSLMVVRLANQIRAQFGLEVPVRELFEHTTLRTQAEILDAGDLFRPTEIQLPEILPSNESEILSEAQSAMWFLDQFEGSAGDQRMGGTYNIPAGWRINGPFDLRALAEAMAVLVLRHPILRAAYPAIEGAPSVSHLPPERVALRVLDLQASSTTKPLQRPTSVQRSIAPSLWPRVPCSEPPSFA